MSLRDSRLRMWRDALDMMERADRLQRQFFQLGRAQPCQPTWEPPVDIFQSGQELTILVALPGVAPDCLQILIDGNTLVVRGARPLPSPPGTTIHRLEIPYGHFERHVVLPSGRFELGRRELVNGCLQLSLRELLRGNTGNTP